MPCSTPCTPRVELDLLILDACRNNPCGDPANALGPGLAPIDRAQGETIVADATAAGDVAENGESGNSPFTAALVTALEQPGLELHEVRRRVRGAVREATFSHPPAEAGLARLGDTLGAEQRAAVATRAAEELRLRGHVPPRAPI